jgi:hypothetical protein
MKVVGCLHGFFGLFSDSNGMGAKQDAQQKRPHNYKLVIDPMIHRGGQKIYRFDGIDPAVSFIAKYQIIR